VTSPILQASRHSRFGDPLPFPPGIVGVLSLGLGKGRRLSVAKCVVEAYQLGQNHPVEAHSVEDNMVQGQVETVVLSGKLDQQRAQQRAVEQVIGTRDTWAASRTA